MAKIPVLAPPSPPSSGYFCEVKCGADGYPLSFLPPVPKGHREVIFHWYRDDMGPYYRAFYFFRVVKSSRTEPYAERYVEYMDGGGVYIGEGATTTSEATPALLENNKWKMNMRPEDYYENVTLYVAAL